MISEITERKDEKLLVTSLEERVDELLPKLTNKNKEKKNLDKPKTTKNNIEKHKLSDRASSVFLAEKAKRIIPFDEDYGDF